MAHRRISSAEKGKGLELNQQEPARSARVKAPLPDNSDLLRKHSLTLIGRVTNKTIQKVWSLIPFFTEHWKTEFKPIGSDLENGLFQFQFEREADLLAVLEQRPYHYARWMVIIQRWEPTISPKFPSLIPFWIKVQGLPVHLWTEPIVECIGRDIGLYEKAEISALTVRMRVHIDGLLPLIKNSVVEFPNGDEVAITLVYERLDKHCTKCLRLDHELKECLVARAEAREAKATQEDVGGRSEPILSKDGEQSRVPSRVSSQSQPHNEAFRFSATNREDRRYTRPSQERREYAHQRPSRSQNKVCQERTTARQSSQARERARGDYVRPSYPRREQSRSHNLPEPPSRSYYREVAKTNADYRETGSSASKTHHESLARGNPLQVDQARIPQEVLSEARSELKDYMTQYTKSADPTEREARQERVRQAEEQGEMEETAIAMAKSVLSASAERQRRALEEQDAGVITPERVPATQRLGPSTQRDVASGSKEATDVAQQRLPVSLRLGPAYPNLFQEEGEPAHEVNSEERLPAYLRLGTGKSSPVKGKTTSTTGQSKRKPGRPPPPGKRYKRKQATTKSKCQRIEGWPRKKTPLSEGTHPNKL